MSSNPYQSPDIPAVAEHPPGELRLSAKQLGVQTWHFRLVGLFMMTIGVALSLPCGAYLYFCLRFGVGALSTSIAATAAALALALVFVGWALVNLKPWAWYAAVVLIGLPLLVILALTALALLWQPIRFTLVLLVGALATSGFAGWTLFSNSGRQRYRIVAAAAARQRTRSHEYLDRPIDDPVALLDEPPGEVQIPQAAVADEFER